MSKDLNVCHHLNAFSCTFHERSVIFKQLKKAIFSGWDSFLKQVFQGKSLSTKMVYAKTPKYRSLPNTSANPNPPEYIITDIQWDIIKQPANMWPTLSCENSWAFPKSARILHTSCLAQSLDSSAHQMSWPSPQSSSSSLISYTSLP